MNLCFAGRVLRMLLGLTLLGLTASGVIGAWGWLGLVPLAAGIMNWCPVNKLLGLKQCHIGRRQAV